MFCDIVFNFKKMKYIVYDKVIFLNSSDSSSDSDSSLLNTTIESENNDDDIESENDDDEFETYTNKVISNISPKKENKRYYIYNIASKKYIL